MRKPLAIDTGDTIADVERFDFRGEKYIAVSYEHCGKPSFRGPYGAIFKLIEKNGKEGRAADEFKIPAKDDVVTGKEEFEFNNEKRVLLKYVHDRNRCEAFFDVPGSMLDTARQYLVRFGTEITSNPKEIVTHGAVRILIKRNREEDHETFTFNGKKYIAELYKTPVKHG